MTFKMCVFVDKVVIFSIFYEKTFNYNDIEDFKIGILSGKIKRKHEKSYFVFPPVKGGDLRKVEERMWK